MENNIQNRTTGRRGRPPTVPGLPDSKPEPAVNVEVAQPSIPGLICPWCGRGMVPRRNRSEENKCYAACSLCGGSLALTFRDGKYVSVRKVRPNET